MGFSYVELLRVRNCLRVLTIVLAALLLAGAVARVSLFGMTPIHFGIRAHSASPNESFSGFEVLVAFVVATILGAPFARENEGHLEFALTKPLSRIRLALGTIAVDVGGIALAWLLATIAAFIARVMFGIPTATESGSLQLASAATGLLAPIAWYAMLCAITASMKAGWGAALGLSWLGSWVIIGVASIPLPGNALWASVHALFAILAELNPLRYAQSHQTGDAVVSVGPPTPFGDPVHNLSMLFILTLAYSALAVAQWRRVEA